MIDTDKYEGHRVEPWFIHERNTVSHTHTIKDKHGVHICDISGGDKTDPATRQLIAAAPKLLAEVKRLRELLAVTLSSPDERIQVLERDLLTLRGRVFQLENNLGHAVEKLFGGGDE